MIKYLYLILLLSFSACSSWQKTSIFQIAKDTKYSVVKKTSVQNEDEAKKILQGRYNYLKLLFEQSRDPYYGHPKWSESCLQSNKIGSVSDMTSVSELVVDGNGNPGFCPEQLYMIKAYEIFFYCENDHYVYQVTIPQEAPFDMKKVSLCK